jgi:flagellin
MVVQHNLQAMNTNRQLGITTSAQAKSTEKLSSGYKVNRAADDAAGLSISEKMRSQIRGLNKASSNASDGISAVQTAEGALNEVHSMLQRMNELATQAANDTNTDTDRNAIQKEVDQLTQEIDRVASTTQFNTMNLIDGSFTGKKLQVGALEGQNIDINIKAMSAKGLSLLDGGVASLANGGYLDASKSEAASADNNGVADKLQRGASYRYFDAETVKTQKDTNGLSVVGEGWYQIDDSGTIVGTNKGAAAVKKDGVAAADKVADNQAKANTVLTGTIGVDGKAIFLDSKDTATTTYGNGNTVTISGDGKKATLSGNGVKVDSNEHAGHAMTTIQKAIEAVSSQRSSLGAIQNRLEHTIANLDTTSENTQSAESRIRDTDMASEMVTYSKNNILAQAGQSMLAQANQSTQGVLSLLQ